MISIRCIITLTLLIVVSLTGCSNSKSPVKVDEHLILQISKADSKGIDYFKYKDVKDAATATKIYLILIQASTSNAIVSMSRNADYKITVLNTDPTVSSEPMPFGIWVAPDSAIVSVVAEIGGGYVQLNSDDSATVLSILK
jgi:hypothetical protein